MDGFRRARGCLFRTVVAIGVCISWLLKYKLIKVK